MRDVVLWPYFARLFPDERAVYDELSREPNDRGIAIVAMAVIEQKFEAALKRMIHLPGHLEQRLFEQSGAFSSLGSTSDMALALGIIRLETNQRLRHLTKIRNQFAHYSLRDFDSPEIIKEFNKINDEIVWMAEYPDGRSRKMNRCELFLIYFSQILHGLNQFLAEPAPTLRTPNF
jgi:hypothetical protein